MFLFDEPSPQRIARFLDAQRAAPFSYDEVGATRKDAKTPTGYAVDHNRTRLGRAETRSRGFGRPVLLEDVRRRMGEARARGSASR